MKRSSVLILLILLLAFALTACVGSDVVPGEAEGGAEAATTSLNTNYEDALSLQGQLALGTVRLEGTELAVDETQAGTLLPLWQALQSLINNDTAAEAEINALTRQIQNEMTTDQVAAIGEMALTTDTLAELFESGELGFGPGQAAAQEGTAQRRGGATGNGGGFPGGGPPAGSFPGGGFPQGAGGDGEISEEDLATLEARRSSGDFQERMLTQMVLRLLQAKTGQTPMETDGAILPE